MGLPCQDPSPGHFLLGLVPIFALTERKLIAVALSYSWLPTAPQKPLSLLDAEKLILDIKRALYKA